MDPDLGGPKTSGSATLLKTPLVLPQSQRPMSFNNSTKTLTGFGPGSTNERFLKGLDKKVCIVLARFLEYMRLIRQKS
jgi:hypothetical protein